MVLTIVQDNQAAEARKLLACSQAKLPPSGSRAIIEMITTIMIYKFTTLSREVESMLGISLEQTRVYQEAKEEGREEGRQEGERSLLSIQLERKLGELPPALCDRLTQLNQSQLEAWRSPS